MGFNQIINAIEALYEKNMLCTFLTAHYPMFGWRETKRE